MTCKTCNRDIPDGMLGCAPCIASRGVPELRKLVLDNTITADFYGFRGALHVFDKQGRELSSTPGMRSAWCGARPRAGGESVTFATRALLNKVDGVCKKCLEVKE